MTFNEWFEAQHGKRPTSKPSWDIASELAAHQYEVSRLTALYRAAEEYDASRTSALYAWQLSEKDKEGGGS